MQLHIVDLVIVILYFASLVTISYSIMKKAQQKGNENESFLAADRNMGIVRTAGSGAATDLGGGFSIAAARSSPSTGPVYSSRYSFHSVKGRGPFPNSAKLPGAHPRQFFPRSGSWSPSS